MANILEINGREEPNISTGMPITLTASYRGECYELRRASGPQDMPILHFMHQDGESPEGRLNSVIVMTFQGEARKATGIERYNPHGGIAKWYRMGDGLEMRIEESAREAIRNLPNYFVRENEIDPSRN